MKETETNLTGRGRSLAAPYRLIQIRVPSNISVPRI